MKDTINQLEQKRFNLLLNKQYDEFKAMCDDDLRYVHSSGGIDDLTSYMAHLESGFYEYKSMRYDIQNVIDMQDYVMATGDFYADILVDGKPKTLQNRAVSVWRKEGDGFKFLMYQGTPF